MTESVETPKLPSQAVSKAPVAESLSTSTIRSFGVAIAVPEKSWRLTWNLTCVPVTAAAAPAAPYLADLSEAHPRGKGAAAQALAALGAGTPLPPAPDPAEDWPK